MRISSPLTKWQKFNQKLAKTDDYIPFHLSSPNLEIFSKSNLSLNYRLFQQTTDKKNLDYVNEDLENALKDEIATQICHPLKVVRNQLAFTCGAQQALFFSLSILMKTKSLLIFEKTNYVGLDSLSKQLDIKTKLLPSIGKLSLSQMEKLFSKYQNSILYLQPDVANPTAKTMSLAHRKQIVQLSKKNNLAIIEDLTYRPLIKSPLPSLRELDQNIISVFSGSKIFFPSLRLGWVIADQKFIKQINILTRTVNLSSPLLSKAIAHTLLTKSNHLKRTRLLYQQKMELLIRELNQKIPAAKFIKPAGGYYLWVKLPKKLTLNKMVSSKIAIAPGEIFSFQENYQQPFFRFSISQVSDEQIINGVDRLAKLFS